MSRRTRAIVKYSHWWVALLLLLAACAFPAAQAGSDEAWPATAAPVVTATRPPRLAQALPPATQLLPTTTVPAPTATADPARTAEISELRGQAEWREQEGGSWLPAKAGDGLRSGNQLRTGDESFATLLFTEGTIARVAPNTIFTIRQLTGTPSDPFTEFTLYLGQIFVILSGQGDESFEINTPLGVASVRGSFLSVWVGPDGHLVVGCLETQRVCELTTGQGRVELRTGQQSEIIASDWAANGTPMTAMRDVAPGLAESLTAEQRAAWMAANPEAVLMEREDADSDGFSIADGDCVDSDRGIFPGAYDKPRDGIDQNCDGADGLSPDADYDTVTVFRGDCNDADPDIHPGAYDRPGDGVDQDCDGEDAGAVVIDADRDGLADSVDMCPAVPGHQRDIGCASGDPDYDNLWGEADNCREVYNPEQADRDRDGRGDACDPDAPTEPAATQTREPEVRQPDPERPTGVAPMASVTPTQPRATRTPLPGVTAPVERAPSQAASPTALPVRDRDGDGVPDEGDNCGDQFNPAQTDSDGDGQGDACDSSGPAPAQPSRTPEPSRTLEPTRTPPPTPEPDGDQDGIPDSDDNCPVDRNPKQRDTDGDGLGDVCDPTPNGSGGGYPGPQP